MRSKPWTLGTIDKLHEARQSPVSLLHPGFAGTLVSRAPLGFLIMLVFWYVVMYLPSESRPDTR